MVHHGEKLKEIIRNLGYSDTIVADKLGISRTTLHNLYFKSKFKAKYLDEIILVLNLDKTIFEQSANFVETKSVIEDGIDVFTNIKNLYERLLEEKDRRIKEKETQIADLRKMLSLVEKRDMA
jgi:DNA-binding XRE family transcriptional regulator